MRSNNDLLFVTTKRHPLRCETIDAIDDFASAKYRKLQRFFLADDRECDKCLQVETLSSSRDSISFRRENCLEGDHARGRRGSRTGQLAGNIPGASPARRPS